VLVFQIVLTNMAMRAAHGRQLHPMASFILSLLSGLLGWFVISILPL